MPINEGIGTINTGRANVFNLKEPARIDITQSQLSELQGEIAKSRVLQAAFEHMRDLGVVDPAAMFELSFGLKF